MKQLFSISLGVALGLGAAFLQASEIKYEDPNSWKAPEEEYSRISSKCEKDKNPDACYKLALLRSHGRRNTNNIADLAGNSAVACRRGSAEACSVFFEMLNVYPPVDFGKELASYADRGEIGKFMNVQSDEDSIKKLKDFLKLVMKDSCKTGGFSSCLLSANKEKPNGSKAEKTKILLKGIEKKEDLSYVLLGDSYQEEEKLEEAHKILSIGCDADGRLSCLKLSELLGNDDYSGKNRQKRIEVEEKACKLGSSKACASLAEVAFGLFMANDREKKKTYLHRACFYGDAESCHAEAAAILTDYADALESKGINLTLLLDSSHKFTPEELKIISEAKARAGELKEESDDYMSKSCLLGYPLACATLGKDKIEAKQYQMARFYFEKGSKSKYIIHPSKFYCDVMLGVMYLEGTGVRQDCPKAVQYLKEASRDRWDACMFLGDIYSRGAPGVKKDLKVAKEYFGKACDKGKEDGCKRYAQINRQGF